MYLRSLKRPFNLSYFERSLILTRTFWYRSTLKTLGSNSVIESQQSRYQDMGSKNVQRDTHFVCFPLVTKDSIPQLASSLAYFRTVTTLISPREKADGSKFDTDSPDRIRVIPSIAHRPPGTFHLTLGTMNLSDRKKMEAAMKLIQEIDYRSLLEETEISTRVSNEEEMGQDITDPGNAKRISNRPTESSDHITTSLATDHHSSSLIQVSLHGIGAFSSPKVARVFYAHPRDPSGRLLHFALAICQKFKDAGFITEARPLVLHATIANMSYAKRNKGHGRGGRQSGRNHTVDATEIIRMFSEQSEESTKNEPQNGNGEGYIWAQDIIIDRVRLCKMGAEKAEDEVLGLEYRPVAEKMIFDNT